MANYCLKNSVVDKLAHNANPDYKAKVHAKCSLTFTFHSAHLIVKILQGVDEIVNSFHFFILNMTFEWLIHIRTDNLRLSFIFVCLCTHMEEISS